MIYVELLPLHSQCHCKGTSPLSHPYIFRKSYYCSAPLLLACPRMCFPRTRSEFLFCHRYPPTEKATHPQCLLLARVPSTRLFSMDTNRPEMAFGWSSCSREWCEFSSAGSFTEVICHILTLLGNTGHGEGAEIKMNNISDGHRC